MADIKQYIRSKLDKFKTDLQLDKAGIRQQGGNTYVSLGPRIDQGIRSGWNTFQKSTSFLPIKESVQIASRPVLLSRENIEPFQQASTKTAKLAILNAVSGAVAPYAARIPYVGTATSKLLESPVTAGVKAMFKPGFIATSGLVGAGIGKLTGEDPIQTGFESAARAPGIQFVLGSTAPALQQFGPTLNAIKNPAVKQLVARGTSAAANVAEGLAIDKATGLATTPLSVGVDLVTGALFPGQVGFKKQAVIDEKAITRANAYAQDIKNTLGVETTVGKASLKDMTPNEMDIANVMKRQVEQAKKNILKGNYDPIVVDPAGNILDGHYKFVAANELGWKEFPVVTQFPKQKISYKPQADLTGAGQLRSGYGELPPEIKVNADTILGRIKQHFNDPNNFGQKRLLSDVVGAGIGSTLGIDVKQDEVTGRYTIGYDPARGAAGAALFAAIADASVLKTRPDAGDIDLSIKGIKGKITPEIEPLRKYANSFNTYTDFMQSLGARRDVNNVARVNALIKQAGFESTQDFWKASRYTKYIDPLEVKAGLSTKALGDVEDAQKSTDLMAEARKYKSAEEFVSRKTNELWNRLDKIEERQKELNSINLLDESKAKRIKISTQLDNLSKETDRLNRDYSESKLTDIWNKANAVKNVAPTGGEVQVGVNRVVEQKLRTDKFNVDKKLQNALEKLQADMGLDSRRVRTMDDMREIADVLGTEPQKLLRDIETGRITDSEVMALGDIISTSSQRVASLSKQLAKDPASESLRNQLQIEEDLLNRALKQRIRGGTEAGRAVVAFRAIANNTLDPVYWLDKAKRQVGSDKDLSPDVVEAINTLIKDKDRVGLAVFVTKLGESSGLEKAIGLWKAGLLTGLRTHEANMISNAAFGGLETVKDIPATAFDIIRSWITGGPRTKTVSVKQLTSQVEGAKRGASYAREYLANGVDPREAGRLDFHKPLRFGNTSGGRLAQSITDKVFGALGAEDKVFREAAFSRSIAEQAAVEGINKNLSVADIRVLAENPTESMIQQALDDAKYATFNKDNAVATGISALKKAGGSVVSAPVDFTMPFVRTPSNVAEALVDYSPAGIIKSVVKKIANKNSVTDRQLAEAFGRSATGLGIIWAGVQLAKSGVLSGPTPSSEADRAQRELENKPSNAILINGKWQALGRISPLGNLLILGASFYESNGDISQTTASGVKSLTEQTFLKGLSQALEAVNNPEQGAEKYISSAVSGFVPSIVSDVARGLDTVERVSKGTQQRIMARVPGLRAKLEPKLTPLGDQVKTEGGLVGSMFNPFNSKTPSNDPLVLEMQRVGYSLNYVGDTLGNKKLTQEQKRVYQQKTGTYIRQFVTPLVQSETYQALDTETQRSLVEKAVLRAKDVAREEMKLDIGKYTKPDVGIFGAKNAEAAEFETSRDAPQNIIDRAKLYGQAVFVDPKTTVKALFTQERARKLRGDTLILERQTGLNKTPDTSDAVDHIVPLSLGGDNSPKNLRTITKEENAMKFSQIESKLIKDLESGKVTEEEAQQKVREYVANNPDQTPPSSPDETKKLDDVQQNVLVQTMKASGKEYEVIGDTAYLLRGNKVKEVSLLPNKIETPTSTGSDELDKRLWSQYRSALTARAKDVVDLYKKGIIDATKADELLSDVETKTKKAKSKGKAKKGKKLRVAMPKVARIKTKKTRLKTITLKMPKNPKIKRPKLPKVANLYRKLA